MGVRVQRSNFHFDFVTKHKRKNSTMTTKSYSFKPDKKSRVTSSVVDGNWHTVIIVVAGNYVSFTLDCLQYAAVDSSLKKFVCIVDFVVWLE